MTCPVEIGQCYCNARVRIWHEAADRGSVTSRQILRVEQTCHGRRGTAESDPLRSSARSKSCNAAISCRTEVCYPWVESTGGPVVKRRSFITLLGGAAVAWPLAARAQQARKIRKIGVLSPSVPIFTSANSALANGLRELGWIEGQNIAIERRYAENRLERLPGLAAELVRLNVEVIVAVGTLGPLAAKRATTPVPQATSSNDVPEECLYC